MGAWEQRGGQAHHERSIGQMRFGAASSKPQVCLTRREAMRMEIASDQEHEEVYAQIIDDVALDWARVTHEQGRYILEVAISPGQVHKFDLDEVIATLLKAKARLGG
jgi:hypothetical protein